MPAPRQPRRPVSTSKFKGPSRQGVGEQQRPRSRASCGHQRATHSLTSGHGHARTHAGVESATGSNAFRNRVSTSGPSAGPARVRLPVRSTPHEPRDQADPLHATTPLPPSARNMPAIAPIQDARGGVAVLVGRKPSTNTGGVRYIRGTARRGRRAIGRGECAAERDGAIQGVEQVRRARAGRRGERVGQLEGGSDSAGCEHAQKGARARRRGEHTVHIRGGYLGTRMKCVVRVSPEQLAVYEARGRVGRLAPHLEARAIACHRDVSCWCER